MAKINELTEQKIKAAAKIVDVFADAGITLHRQGSSLACLCPFHQDRELGSFVVNERLNIYKCFSCDAKGDPVKFVMDYYGKKYPEALRYLAAMYDIYVDNEPAPQVVKREPRKPLPPLKWIVWPIEILKPYLHHTEENELLTWMLSLPMREEHKHNLRNMIELYMIGTSQKGYTKGWTIFPQVNMEMKVQDMKFMRYLSDGHRDKAHNPNWMSAMLAKSGQLDRDSYQAIRCLFGLHLAAIFTEAEICLVESEKTALLCSSFCDPTKRIWMAVGGLQFFKPHMLEPLIKTNRYLIAYPDADGVGRWQEVIESIGYNRMSMTTKMLPISAGGEYDPVKDGPKADIADIMIRKMSDLPETEAEKVARLLGAHDKAKDIAYMMNKLELKLNK